MLRLSFDEFASLVKYINTDTEHQTENRDTLYREIHRQIRYYENQRNLKLGDGTPAIGEAAEVHRIFELVASETGIPMRVRRDNR